MTEDDDCDVDRAKHGELVRLLEQTALALEEGDGPGRHDGELVSIST